ncbi:DUF3060 domain-containing protein [Methylocystis parvus]|uniref:DUF3060 domain-containing protein n=1 Tax=Methylocystis parvus TaxID=134 RepID=A0A6B8M3L5_9HYPH|nr:DUF3060 domain-containing protein [Methylocystis parvus]QGM97491.1 DUF3060 domain-containing protein [Methylocystis parvus]WBJ98589.1 DUF3060 domain-containing protein [Methylocystis parvus OBBP]
MADGSKATVNGSGNAVTLELGGSLTLSGSGNEVAFGAGNDVVTDSGSSEVFIFRANFGQDTIAGFDSGSNAGRQRGLHRLGASYRRGATGRRGHAHHGESDGHNYPQECRCFKPESEPVPVYLIGEESSGAIERPGARLFFVIVSRTKTACPEAYALGVEFAALLLHFGHSRGDFLCAVLKSGELCARAGDFGALPSDHGETTDDGENDGPERRRADDNEREKRACAGAVVSLAASPRMKRRP